MVLLERELSIFLKAISWCQSITDSCDWLTSHWIACPLPTPPALCTGWGRGMVAQKEHLVHSWRVVPEGCGPGVVTLHSDQSSPGTPKLLCSTAGTGPTGGNQHVSANKYTAAWLTKTSHAVINALEFEKYMSDDVKAVLEYCIHSYIFKSFWFMHQINEIKSQKYN